MKQWAWCAVVFVVTFLIISILKIPLWLFIIFALPLLLVIFVYGSFFYNSRPTVRLIYWTLTKRGRAYTKSIEQQHRSGMIQLSVS